MVWTEKNATVPLQFTSDWLHEQAWHTRLSVKLPYQVPDEPVVYPAGQIAPDEGSFAHKLEVVLGTQI